MTNPLGLTDSELQTLNQAIDETKTFDREVLCTKMAGCPDAEVITHDDEQWWLDERKNYITASDVAVILGHHPRKSPLTLYNEKIGLLDGDDLSSNEPVKWGKRLEAVIADAYTEETGRGLIDPGRFTLLRSKKYPWLAATLDRIVLPGEHGPAGALEIKNTNAFLAKDWADEPPVVAQVQVQCQMLVTGLTYGSLAALIGGNRFFWVDQQFNAGFAELMIEKTGEFMRRLETGNPPEADGSESTKEAIRRLYPRDSGETIALPAEAMAWADALKDVKSEMKELEVQKDLLENKIKLAIGEASAGVFLDGSGFSYKLTQRKGYVVEPTEYRTLRATKAK